VTSRADKPVPGCHSAPNSVSLRRTAHQRGRTGHFDAFGHRSDYYGERELYRLIHLQMDARSRLRLKSLRLGGNGILADAHIRHVEFSTVICTYLAGFFGALVNHGDDGTGNDRSRGVCHDPNDGAGGDLSCQ
jgi:hypothetical protein